MWVFKLRFITNGDGANTHRCCIVFPEYNQWTHTHIDSPDPNVTWSTERCFCTSLMNVQCTHTDNHWDFEFEIWQYIDTYVNYFGLIRIKLIKVPCDYLSQLLSCSFHFTINPKYFGQKLKRCSLSATTVFMHGRQPCACAMHSVKTDSVMILTHAILSGGYLTCSIMVNWTVTTC